MVLFVLRKDKEFSLDHVGFEESRKRRKKIGGEEKDKVEEKDGRIGESSHGW